MKNIYDDIMTMKPRYDTFGENLFWSYANWQMIFATAQYGVEKFDRRSYMIRQGCYKKLCDGSRHISDLYKMNQTKVKAGNYCFLYAVPLCDPGCSRKLSGRILS